MMTLGHSADLNTHSPLTTMAGEQTGWVYINPNNSTDSTQIMFSIAWQPYLDAPHVESNFNKLAQAEKLFNNPSSSIEFSNNYKVFKFSSKEFWFKEIKDESIEYRTFDDEYGLTGFIVAANPDMPNTQKGDMLLYLQNSNVELLMKNDLRVNNALWEAGNNEWFNLNISTHALRELTTYENPMEYVYHSPILSWEEPDVIFTISLGLLNWSTLYR